MNQEEALVNIIEGERGKVEIRINQSQYRPIIMSLSQAMCGAFDVAGEHENEVFLTIKAMIQNREEEEESEEQPAEVH